MKVFRITDHALNKCFYVATRPHVRRYKLQAPVPELITVEEFDYNYKWQLVVLLNEALKKGEERYERL